MKKGKCEVKSDNSKLRSVSFVAVASLISSVRSEYAVEGRPEVFNPSVFLQFPFIESTLLFNFAFSATNLTILFVIYVLILMVAWPGWVLGLNFVLRLMMLIVLFVEAGFGGFVCVKSVMHVESSNELVCDCFE